MNHIESFYKTLAKEVVAAYQYDDDVFLSSEQLGLTLDEQSQATERADVFENMQRTFQLPDEYYIGAIPDQAKRTDTLVNLVEYDILNSKEALMLYFLPLNET